MTLLRFIGLSTTRSNESSRSPLDDADDDDEGSVWRQMSEAMDGPNAAARHIIVRMTRDALPDSVTPAADDALWLTAGGSPVIQGNRNINQPRARQ